LPRRPIVLRPRRFWGIFAGVMPGELAESLLRCLLSSDGGRLALTVARADLLPEPATIASTSERADES